MALMPEPQICVPARGQRPAVSDPSLLKKEASHSTLSRTQAGDKGVYGTVQTQRHRAQESTVIGIYLY